MDVFAENRTPTALNPARVKTPSAGAMQWMMNQPCTVKQQATIKRMLVRIGADETFCGELLGDGFKTIEQLSKTSASYAIQMLSILYKIQCEENGRMDLWESTT